MSDHSPDCDTQDLNPDGIRKPCNCGAQSSLSRAFGSAPVAPLSVRLSVDANRCAPSLASMIARVLRDAGATVTFGDNAAEMPEKPITTLRGLRVHIDRLTWVCDEEAERWKDREPNT